MISFFIFVSLATAICVLVSTESSTFFPRKYRNFLFVDSEKRKIRIPNAKLIFNWSDSCLLFKAYELKGGGYKLLAERNGRIETTQVENKIEILNSTIQGTALHKEIKKALNLI